MIRELMMMMKDEELELLAGRIGELNIVGEVDGPPGQDEAEHFAICPTCGQAIDQRDLAMVILHSRDEHARSGLDS